MPVFNWLQIGIGAAGALLLSYLVGAVYINHIEANHRADLVYQQGVLEGKCNDDKAITKKADDALRVDRDAIAAKLAGLKRLHPTTCVTPATGKTIVSGVSTEHAGQGGAVTGSTDDFRDYFAECETIRISYNVCTKFIDDVWQ